MGAGTDKAARLFKAVVIAALVVWGGVLLWRFHQARRAGAVLSDALTAAWPEGRPPQAGSREQVLSAAENLRDGAFGRVVSDLGPAQVPTGEQRTAAEKFLIRQGALRDRFLSAATAAEAQERDGADVRIIRDALARTLIAAAREDAAGAERHLALAEKVLDSGVSAGGPGGDAEVVAGLVGGIAPAFRLGEELMTEGHAAAEKLMTRASRLAQAGDFRQAAAMVRLAGDLLGVSAGPPSDSPLPEWFTDLAKRQDKAVDVPVSAAIALAEPMAAAEPSGGPVQALVRKARRDLDAGKDAQAAWWACVALNALGMTDEAIAASAKQEEAAPAEPRASRPDDGGEEESE